MQKLSKNYIKKVILSVFYIFQRFSSGNYCFTSNYLIVDFLARSLIGLKLKKCCRLPDPIENEVHLYLKKYSLFGR